MDLSLLRFDPVVDIDLDDPTDESAGTTVRHFVPLMRTIGLDTDIEAMYLALVDDLENTFRRVGYYVGHSQTALIPNDIDIAPFRKTFKLG